MHRQQHEQQTLAEKEGQFEVIIQSPHEICGLMANLRSVLVHACVVDLTDLWNFIFPNEIGGAGLVCLCEYLLETAHVCDASDIHVHIYSGFSLSASGAGSSRRFQGCAPISFSLLRRYRICAAVHPSPSSRIFVCRKDNPKIYADTICGPNRNVDSSGLCGASWDYMVAEDGLVTRRCGSLEKPNSVTGYKTGLRRVRSDRTWSSEVWEFPVVNVPLVCVQTSARIWVLSEYICLLWDNCDKQRPTAEKGFYSLQRFEN